MVNFLSNNSRENFYRKVLNETILNKSFSILICGGGLLDVSVFKNLGFKNVVISNLDVRNSDKDFYPYKWKFENAEELSFEDSSFDYVVIHAAIHHASSPHKVLTEMYRVCRKGVLAFESRDSLLMKLMERFNLTQTYETSAVFFNGCEYGGG